MTEIRSRRFFAVAICGACLSLLLVPAGAIAQGYRAGDLIVADYTGKIAVFDRELNFKNYLDTDFNLVTGLDFTSTGDLVATGRGPGTIRRYNPAGQLVDEIIDDAVIADPIDIKVGPGDSLYVGTQSAAVAELTLEGDLNRTFGSLRDPQGIAVLPNGELWVGHGTGGDFVIDNPIQVFSLASGALTRTIPLDHYHEVGTMFYSAATDTVLLTDPPFGTVYEYAIDGSLVREFGGGDSTYAYGVTRADDGVVYVTSQLSGNVARYDSDGTFLDSTNLSPYVDVPIGIVQVPVPEPGSLWMICIGLVGYLRFCRR